MTQDEMFVVIFNAVPYRLSENWSAVGDFYRSKGINEIDFYYCHCGAIRDMIPRQYNTALNITTISCCLGCANNKYIEIKEISVEIYKHGF